MDNEKIIKHISNMLEQSDGGDGSQIAKNSKDALSTYLGDRGRVADGKSSVVSTDVADVVEWIMPEIMKAFTQNNEIVSFDPTDANDVTQALIESKYVYDSLMKDNNGFIVLHQFVKDALLQKNGFIKVYKATDVVVEKEYYQGITEDALNILKAQADVEIIQTHKAGQYYDVAANRISSVDSVKVESVAPENFRVIKTHNSPSLDSCRFCATIEYRTIEELKRMGYDIATLELQNKYTSGSITKAGDYRFTMQGESTGSGEDEIELAECYTYLDYDGDGYEELVKVLIANPGLDGAVVLDVEEITSVPIISATAIMMSHKLYGLSICDRIKELQRIKTSVLRNTLDNYYLQNNQRTIVQENMVNLDDLLVSRAGGVVRVKSMQAIQPMQTNPIGSSGIELINYIDSVRAGRSGVTPEGNTADTMIGSAVGSQGVERVMTAREELVGLMVRVFAETGIKPLVYKIRELLISIGKSELYNYGGAWVEVQPSSWKQRNRSTVRVGTGSGDKSAKMALLAQIIGFQKELVANGSNYVQPDHIYNAMEDMMALGGLSGAHRYFVNPTGEADPYTQIAMLKQQMAQIQQESQMQIQLAHQQMQQGVEAATAKATIELAQAESGKVRVQGENLQLKSQVEAAEINLKRAKAEYDMKIETLKLQDDRDKANSKFAIEAQDSDRNYALRSRELDIKEAELAASVLGDTK